jgi:hypothetical protein
VRVAFAGDLWNANNATAFTLRIRAVGSGGCTVDLQGIVEISFDTTSELFFHWRHFWDSDWNMPQLQGQCQK